MTTTELKSKKSVLVFRSREILNNAKKENREMTPDEQQEFDNNLAEIETLNAQVEELQEQLLEAETKVEEKPEEEVQEEEKPEEKSDEEETPKEDEETGEEETPDNSNEEEVSEEKEEKTDEEETPESDKTEEEKQEDSEEEINNKNNRNHNIMTQNLITKEIRSAIENGSKKFTVNAETRTGEMVVAGNVHDKVIENEYKGLLEPLYAESVLAKLGIRFYNGLPMGDVKIPAMAKGTCGWEGEIAPAGVTNNTFSTVTLKPKRLTAYVDISKQLIAQDTLGINDAIKRDIYNALIDKLQATVLSDDDKTETSPAGIFHGVEPTAVTDFKGLCELEALVDDSNVGGEKKYLMSNSAKASFRAMAKSTKSTQLVMENGEIDGTPVVATSAVAGKNFAYGNFDNVVIGSWGDIEIVVDEYTQAINGCIRLVINAYFDCQKVREDEDVIVYGTIA